VSRRLLAVALWWGLTGSASCVVGGEIVGRDPVRMCLGEGPAAVARASACAAPGTDPAYVGAFWEEHLRLQGVDPLSDFFTTARWSGGGQGTPHTVTYSFPSDGFGGITGWMTSQNVLHWQMSEWFGSVQNGKSLFRQMFDRWEALSGARYIEVSDDNAAWGSSGGATRGDIRIVSVAMDGPGNIWAYNFFPNNGDMVIDSSDDFGLSFGNYRAFRNLIAHENGHGMGVLHVCPANATKIMEPFIVTNYDGPQHDDIRAMQRHYGDTLEPNDGWATATSLGSLQSGGSLVVRDVSIDNPLPGPNQDVDWYRVTLESAAEVSVTVVPVGFAYPNTAQAGENCPSGSLIDSKSVLDLSFAIFGSDGTTQLVSVDQTSFGEGESLDRFATAGGAFYLRVRAAESAMGTPPQMYQCLIRSEAGACPGDANGDRVVNFLDLNIVLGQFGQAGIGLPGDVTGDGRVDFLDLNLVLSYFSSVC